MNKIGVIALFAVTATLAGAYCLSKKDKRLRRCQSIFQFPFIDDVGESRHANNRVFWKLNAAQRKLREACIEKELKRISEKKYTGLTRVERQQVLGDLDDIIQELIGLGYVITPSQAVREVINKYYYAATRDMETYLNSTDSVANIKKYHPDFDVYAANDPCVVAIVAVNIIRRNVSKGIFPDDAAFRVAMLTKLLDRASLDNAIYTLCYIVNHTDIMPRDGWVLMLEAYKLKYCIEGNIEYKDFDEDLFFMALDVNEGVLDYLLEDPYPVQGTETYTQAGGRGADDTHLGSIIFNTDGCHSDFDSSAGDDFDDLDEDFDELDEDFDELDDDFFEGEADESDGEDDEYLTLDEDDELDEEIEPSIEEVPSEIFEDEGDKI